MLPCVAQRYNFRFYGEEQGLTNLAVQCFVQDHVRASCGWARRTGYSATTGGGFSAFDATDGLPSRASIRCTKAGRHAVGGDRAGFGAAVGKLV